MSNISIKVKYAVDRILSIIAIILLSPILIITSIIIKLDSDGPVIFKQERVGLNGRPFYIYKFRSMVQNAQYIGAGLYIDGDDDPRITKVGKFIRKTSIDELPQLFNVAKGEMSLIGPRPFLKITTNEMTEKQRKRLLVKPGMTGLAQVNGRLELSFEQRIEYDLLYIDNYNWMLDLKIFFKTIYVVLLRKGTKIEKINSKDNK